MSGFIGTAGLTVALVAAAVGGTGAYFTDSDAGNLSAVAGHINITASDTYINLTGLMPGTDQTARIPYSIDASAPVDVWMVFDVSTDANMKAFAAFTGTKVVGGPDGLGRFGHFAVSSNGGAPLFESYNMAAAPAGNTDTCGINANGNGGSSAKAKAGTFADEHPSYCGVPAAIKIESNVQGNASGNYVGVTFGLTGMASGYQNLPWANVPFKITATQVGVRPDALNF